MEKLIVGPGAKGTIDLNLPLADNLQCVAAALGKPLSELTVTILANHATMPLSLKCSNRRTRICYSGRRRCGLNFTCMPDSEVDVLYGLVARRKA